MYTLTVYSLFAQVMIIHESTSGFYQSSSGNTIHLDFKYNLLSESYLEENELRDQKYAKKSIK